MNKHSNEFEQVLIRLHEVGIKTQRQLASALQITPGGISAAKKRGKFPKGWAVTLSNLYGVTIDSVLGIGSTGIILKRGEPSRQDHIDMKNEIISHAINLMAEQKAKYWALEKDNEFLRQQVQFLEKKIAQEELT